ncbi:5'-nucleotidase C-terminal domain-containing protein [Domibacillus aminovorans]|nr:5'-nucleotidase C-terminal domain-containing protein [Domibacillus aminovorans]
MKAEIVGSTPVALDGERANVWTGETNLGNLMTDSMLAKAKTIDAEAVIALQNGGGIRSSINEGDITMEEVLTVMPFDNSWKSDKKLYYLLYILLMKCISCPRSTNFTPLFFARSQAFFVKVLFVTTHASLVL